MAAFANKSILQAYIADLLHRSDVGSLTNKFIDLASERLGAELRTNANEATVLITDAGAGLYTLPADYAEARAVYGSWGGQPMTLRPLGTGGREQFEASGPDLFGYQLIPSLETGTQTAGYELLAIPATGADLTLDYWQVPTLAASSQSSSPVLVAYGMLYLYASMVEATSWTQNFEISANWNQKYLAELTRVNAAANKARYGSGLHRGPSARFYKNTPSRAM